MSAHGPHHPRSAMLAVLVAASALALVCATAFGDAPAPVRSRSADLVYPPRPRGLIMNHLTAAHRELPCARCHQPSGPPASPSKREPSLVPREASCVPCHEERTDRARPGAATCGFCHRGFEPTQAPAIAAVHAEPARLVFSHARHHAAQVPCARCHGEPGAAAPGGGVAWAPHMPAMSECMDCHQGARNLACNGCHLALPSGLLRTRFPDGKLVPRNALPDLAHDADFRVRHRWLAADDGATCASCHTEQDCTDCHDGVRRPRSVHPGDYLALHAQEAQRNAARCNSCHTTQSFCLPCHARLGVSSVSAPDLATPKRLHPPGAVWVRGPAQHAREAKRSLSTCVSCHAERDCVVCHGGQGVGAGLSPHPPGFRRECAGRLRANSRGCVTCHRDLGELEARCR